MVVPGRHVFRPLRHLPRAEISRAWRVGRGCGKRVGNYSFGRAWLRGASADSATGVQRHVGKPAFRFAEIHDVRLHDVDHIGSVVVCRFLAESTVAAPRCSSGMYF